MDILFSFLGIIGILFAVVIYQSRKEKPDIKMYISRFSRLIIIILSFFKDIGVCAADKFNQINWDLTISRVPINKDTLKSYGSKGAYGTIKLPIEENTGNFDTVIKDNGDRVFPLLSQVGGSSNLPKYAPFSSNAKITDKLPFTATLPIKKHKKE